jgi:hypothetical protein
MQPDIPESEILAVAMNVIEEVRKTHLRRSDRIEDS